VLSLSSNKGGVGKTSIATNLAIYLRALREDLPILLLGFDEQPMIDRMFAIDPKACGETTADALRRGSLDGAIELGQYGVHYVPSSPAMFELKQEIRDPFFLRDVLAATDWSGLVIIDTKSDFEILTRNALAASDLAIVVVKDHASLIEAQRVFDLLEDWRMPPARARILLSLMDRRVKYREGQDRDILALLVSEIRELDLPLFDTFVSRSPKVEALTTNPQGRALSILHGARGSLVHKQMRHLAYDVLAALALDELASPAASAPRTAMLLEALTARAALALPEQPLRLERFPVRIGRLAPGIENDIGIPDQRPWHVSKHHVELVERDGRVGVVDLGSRMGTLVDGHPLGGRSGDLGPRFFEGDSGRLVLGNASSPFAFEVRILGSPQRGPSGR
jgi:cellulose biosynthesis protein BcsQ